MANEDKIRILDEQPAENAGSLLYIRTLAGSSDASKPTSQLANGSVFIETDTGKVFIFDEDNGWTEMQAGGGGGGSDKFIVTLTPTAEDFRGTMDKTVAEINAAYEAGQEILFDVRVSGNVTLRSNMTEVYIDTNFDFPSFQANVMVDSATLMKAYTGATNDGTKQTYGTMVYGV